MSLLHPLRSYCCDLKGVLPGELRACFSCCFSSRFLLYSCFALEPFVVLSLPAPPGERDSDAPTPRIFYTFLSCGRFLSLFSMIPCVFFCTLSACLSCTCENTSFFRGWMASLFCCFLLHDESAPGTGHGWRKQEGKRRQGIKVSNRRVGKTYRATYSYHERLRRGGGCLLFFFLLGFSLPVFAFGV